MTKSSVPEVIFVQKFLLPGVATMLNCAATCSILASCCNRLGPALDYFEFFCILGHLSSCNSHHRRDCLSSFWKHRSDRWFDDYQCSIGHRHIAKHGRGCAYYCPAQTSVPILGERAKQKSVEGVRESIVHPLPGPVPPESPIDWLWCFHGPSSTERHLQPCGWPSVSSGLRVQFERYSL